MAKYNSSAFGNISGEVLGVVASSNKGINFIKNKAKTTDAKTERQLARRAIYEEFCKLWDEKQVGGSVASYKEAYIKGNIFRNTLGFTLKHSENASLLWLTVCPTNGTMSAPIYTKINAELIENGQMRVQGVFLFPAFDDSGEFGLFSAVFGHSIYDYSYRKITLEVYSQGIISSRELSLTARLPNSTQSELLGQKVFRSWWYINKKTGQVSKPLCTTCDESGNVEIFYPFGK